MNEIRVRRGCSSDIPDCLRIAEGLPDYFTPPAILKMGSALKEQLILVATDSEVKGFLTVRNHSGKAAELTWLAVKRDQWRQGIGTALVNAMVRELESLGCALVQVKTLDASAEYGPYEATRRFYEQCGFFHLETIDPYPGWDAGNPCAIYVKVLGLGSS